MFDQRIVMNVRYCYKFRNFLFIFNEDYVTLHKLTQVLLLSSFRLQKWWYLLSAVWLEESTQMSKYTYLTNISDIDMDML